ncbi:MAG: (d)CMP kinase [Pseudomonadaceae bacterium]|nr:(d)CMP kinase [Pseudomonadaceae bacterium]
MNAVPVITVDGPSGSGKGTLARALAEHLNWHLLDSGALYRIVAFSALNRDMDLSDGEALAALAEGLDIEFSGDQVLVDGVDVSLDIRRDETGFAASEVSAHPPVRAALLSLQKKMRRSPGLVADGRDMGTVVFTDAELKVFLDASVEERARRRHKQLKDKGVGGSLAALRESIAERDARDKRRTVSPLAPASDAIQIDSTQLAIDEVITLVLDLARERGLGS